MEYDFIRSNRLFFKVDIDVPDTDWEIGSDFLSNREKRTNRFLEYKRHRIKKK